MTATTAGSIRNCPACNARNTRFSLFCAECGTSLNGETVAGETAAFAPLTGRDDAQQTSAFEPASRDYGTDAGFADAEPAEQAPADRDYRPYWEQSTPTAQAPPTTIFDPQSSGMSGGSSSGRMVMEDDAEALTRIDPGRDGGDFTDRGPIWAWTFGWWALLGGMAYLHAGRRLRLPSITGVRP
jgi:hypothetical protein